MKTVPREMVTKMESAVNIGYGMVRPAEGLAEYVAKDAEKFDMSHGSHSQHSSSK